MKKIGVDKVEAYSGKSIVYNKFHITRRAWINYMLSTAKLNKLFNYVVLLLSIVLLSISNLAFPNYMQADEELNWKKNWAVNDGYEISIDSKGYQLPSAIAFVPNPGNDPMDPLYFVLELKGTVKIVTNNRSVYTFAKDFFKLGPVAAFGVADSLELGLAGICLSPENGYVFVTFVYQDSRGILRNNIVRFQSTPAIFSILPESHIEFREIFSSEASSPSHQIGSCQVYKNLLYVSVGDGRQPNKSQLIDSTLGKILRMTLDGEPVEQNPFYKDKDKNNHANYTWAYGLRNPFGLKIVQDRVLVGDSGPGVDRILVVNEGENYLWDGSDKSMGTNAISVLSPGKGLSRIDYSANLNTGFPKGFYVNVSGSADWNSPDKEFPTQILYLNYDIEQNKLQNTPNAFLRYRGNANQVLAGLDFGQDGLYFAPLLPDDSDMSAIFKITPNKDSRYPYNIDEDRNVQTLMVEKGCKGCHRLEKGIKSPISPNLYPPLLISRLEERLNSENYAEYVSKMDLLEEPLFVSHKSNRHDILKSEGIERVRLWIKNRLLEPKFDNPHATMPNLGLSEEEANLIADFFVSNASQSEHPIVSAVKNIMPSPAGRRHLVLFFAGGFVVGNGFLFSIYYMIAYIRKFVRSRRRR